MKKILPQSAPFIGAGAIWCIYAILFPFYRMTDLLIAAVLSIVSYIAIRRFVKEPPQKPIQEPEPVLTQEAAKELFRQAESLRKAAFGIEDKEVADHADSIARTVEKIARNIEEDPKDAPKIRSLIRHYMPSITGLFDSYRTFEMQEIDGENLSAAMHKIKASLEDIDQALKKQLDRLFDIDVLDISADIAVLEHLMAKDGLTNGGNLRAEEEKDTVGS